MRLKPLEQSLRTKLARMDWIGMLLFLTGSSLFAVPLSWAGNMYPWGSWRTILPLVIGALTLLIFAIYEARPAEPVSPYRIFRSRTAQMALIGSFIQGMVLYTLLTYLPFVFQTVYLETPLKSAISILPFCCVLMAFSGIAASTVDYFRHYRWEVWTEWIFLAPSAQVIASIGIGTIFTVPPIPMQASAPTAEDQGLAVGVLVSFRLFGTLIGLAVGATTFSSVFPSLIASVGSLPGEVALLRNANEAVGFIPRLRTVGVPLSLRDAICRVYGESLRAIWYILATFGGGGVSYLFTGGGID
ncbi:hypothetical protein ANOM_001070 [Aspergillus nomiae NRRL 13137]|uniref:Uncharacterized protein n=1 Tax=Aspergillus nomiae NRRL (strain ATCC 15546 / NRRL 13137 / CBS 260.88 / M93) TaxID=1509407 RepID=A0A0L1JG14_ASPN3|nr:uncharacterized protein ANOM_001070 [Aspergillus nomiae NRRL 13137]KNG90696.1 hypothetical protein ANOM_001070 [Aspergillus nomiae NRRL 13137]